LRLGPGQLRHYDIGVLRHMWTQGSYDHVHEHRVCAGGLAGCLGVRRRHLRLDVVEKGVQRPFDHGAETLALLLEIELVDLRVEHGADDGAPLVGAQDSVASVRDLGQIGADETARGQAINGLPTEPDGRQEQNHAHGQAEIEGTQMFAL